MISTTRALQQKICFHMIHILIYCWRFSDTKLFVFLDTWIVYEFDLTDKGKILKNNYLPIVRLSLFTFK